jgi:hypothetical protein
MALGEVLLRVVLVVAGAFIVFTGADFALGGIVSLGLEHPPLAVTFEDEHAFHVRDSHTRFIGAVWLGVGLVFLASVVRLQALKTALLACVVFIFIGGLARFSAGHPEILFSSAVLPSLLLELVGMPVLFYWVSRTRTA